MRFEGDEFEWIPILEECTFSPSYGHAQVLAAAVEEIAIIQKNAILDPQRHPLPSLFTDIKNFLRPTQNGHAK